MTILVDGPNAVDIEELETRIERDTKFGSTGVTNTIRGSFLISSCSSAFKSYHGIKLHDNKRLTIIAYLEDKPKERWYITGCHTTTQRTDKYGSRFQFTATNMRRELI